MKIFEKTGKMALGTRLRLLSSKMADDAEKIYNLYQNDFSPKWFPIFFMLAEEGPQTITEMAKYISHSQPSVSKIIQEMTAAGLCKNLASPDKRRNSVQLTEKGFQLSEKLKTQYADVGLTVENMLQEATHNLWEAVAEWEFLLEKKSLLQRVEAQKKLRESQDVKIVPYQDIYQIAFKTLNEEWISTYFEMEETDYQILDNPKEYVLDKGGEILVALYENEPVGVCALVKTVDDVHPYELAKMAVSPKAQGKHIGWLLAKAAAKKAKDLGADKLYLESNTLLKAAINLYEKIGFKKISTHPSPYKRTNIQMELDLAHLSF